MSIYENIRGYTPEKGARFVNIEIDRDNKKYYIPGKEFDSKSLSSFSDIPKTTKHRVLVAIILLYKGQAKFKDSEILIPDFSQIKNRYA